MKNMQHVLILYNKKMYDRKEIKVQNEEEAKLIFDQEKKYKYGFYCTKEYNIIEKWEK